VALGGGGFSMEPDNPLLDNFILSLTGKRQPKVCFVPTASGDSDNYVTRFYRNFDASRCSPSHLPLFHGQLPDLTDLLCSQDVIYVAAETRQICWLYGVSTRWTRRSRLRGEKASYCVGSVRERSAGLRRGLRILLAAG
jgi:peptidase E